MKIIVGAVLTMCLIKSKFAQKNDCKLSETTVNGKKVCEKTVIFEDDFEKFDPKKWEKEQFIPDLFSDSDSMEIKFNYFKTDNVVYNGKQVIFKPEVDESLNSIDFTGNCTSDKERECTLTSKGKYIVPQISTGRITTKNLFSFKYGIIEIIAKVPSGDWLLPEMRLEPKQSIYGEDLISGRIVLALVRGNKDVFINYTNLGEETLESGLLVLSPVKSSIRAAVLRVQGEIPWHKNFNKYTFIWTPDRCSFSVNDVNVGSISGNLLEILFDGNSEDTKTWSTGTAPLAPFDQEFYISLGLSVGGRDFPKLCESNGVVMNTSVDIWYNFRLNRNKWEKTWIKPKDSFKITKIKITSL